MIRAWAKDVYRLSKWHLIDQVRTYRNEAQGSDLVEDGPKYLLPEGYRSRRRVAFTDHERFAASGIVWQPDVYELALQLAQITRARVVMDVGCGHGEKLAKLHPRCEIIGFDTRDNIAWCQQHYEFGKWVAMDLDVDFPQVPPEAQGNTVLICADVVEHIFDADRFLSALATRMRGCVAAVISTPDRRFLYPEGHRGPPDNRCHVREWTAPEFKQLLERLGLKAWVGLSRTNSASPSMETMVAIVSNA